ncbi:hypothetical protein EJB05_57342, partial [Eragrostis curvula]
MYALQKYRRRLPPGASWLRIKHAWDFIWAFNSHRVLAELAKEYGPIASFGTNMTRIIIVVSSSAAAQEALDENDTGLADRFMPDSVPALSHCSGSPLFLPSSNPFILFSKDDVVDLSGQGPQVLKELLVELIAVSTKSDTSDALPFLAPLDLFGLRRNFADCLDRFYKFLDEEFREPWLASGENHVDVLDAILAQYAESRITRPNVTKFFMDIFTAGSEPSSLTVQWALAQLLRNPEKMENVRNELAANLGSQDSVEESDLDKLPYLHAVVKETLSCTRCFRSYLEWWDPASWPQPEEFMPERFLSDQSVDFWGSDFAYKPFGAGRRVCPGMGFAARFVPLLLASTLHKMEWRLPSEMTPEDVDLRDNYRTVLDLATPLCAVPLSLD